MAAQLPARNLQVDLFRRLSGVKIPRMNTTVTRDVSLVCICFECLEKLMEDSQMNSKQNFGMAQYRERNIYFCKRLDGWDRLWRP